jgi:hypothetical protein
MALQVGTPQVGAVQAATPLSVLRYPGLSPGSLHGLLFRERSPETDCSVRGTARTAARREVAVKAGVRRAIAANTAVQRRVVGSPVFGSTCCSWTLMAAIDMDRGLPYVHLLVCTPSCAVILNRRLVATWRCSLLCRLELKRAGSIDAAWPISRQWSAGLAGREGSRRAGQPASGCAGARHLECLS